MCGIAGVMFTEPRRTPEGDSLQRLSEAIAHRGPDGQGTYIGEGIGLVHRRLAIIDPIGAAQPLGNENNSIQITFNGEIYNYRELKSRLESQGHRFRTQSDTEVLVHLYEEHGEAMLDKLRGMYSFAIWDSNKRRLFLSRSRIGIKPLYYHRNADAFWFASEPHALIAAGACNAEVNPHSLDDYLAFGMTLGPKSFYRGIEQLPPAHSLTIERNHWNRNPQRYWQLQFDPDPDPNRDWLGTIHAAVDDAVKSHLVADVPVGAFLSGGVDSGAVVASAALQSSKQLQTFTVGFREEAFNETPYSRALANRYHTDHHEEMMSAEASLWLDVQTKAYDEPLADVSTIPTLMVSKLASRSVKVVLSGDGGDEAFGGYQRYAHDLREDRIRKRLPRWLRQNLIGPTAKIWPQVDRLPRPLRLKTALTNLALDPAEAYANTLKFCRQPLRHRLINTTLSKALLGNLPQRRIIDAFHAASRTDVLSGMIGADLAFVLPDDYLVKIDRASMHYGLEVRPPLLDHRLLEQMAKMPSQWKIRDGVTKWVFKKSQVDRLPAETITRPKQGFLIPVDQWLRSRMPLADMFSDVVLSPNSTVSRLIDPAIARKLFHDHTRGTARNGQILWSILILARWADQYLTPGGRT